METLDNVSANLIVCVDGENWIGWEWGHWLGEFPVCLPVSLFSVVVGCVTGRVSPFTSRISTGRPDGLAYLEVLLCPCGCGAKQVDNSPGPPGSISYESRRWEGSGKRGRGVWLRLMWGVCSQMTSPCRLGWIVLVSAPPTRLAAKKPTPGEFT